ncbi:MAG TPA: Xaa-Pro peptidase family protein [Candidatus Dormibacteraeota bacterium]|jgi:Xaa-Pro dipeptidase|nr:Xaa-Pro peptidase family protein [Candidatus Dormibacteraeota bacterium]
MFDYAQRRGRVADRMREIGVDLLFLPISGDLEYLTGVARRVPSFGNISYRHGWVAGAFLRPGKDPVLILPRMITEFDLSGERPAELVTVKETDDGEAMFQRLAGQMGPVKTLAIGARTWGETVIHLMQALHAPTLSSADPLINPLRRIKSAEELERMTAAAHIVDEVMAEITSQIRPGVTELDLASEINLRMQQRGSRVESFDTGVFSIGSADQRDADVRLTNQPIREGTAVSFDFGAVVDGYCSDFGRTVFVGEPDKDFRNAYDLVIAAQAAGIRAARAGATASQVDHATRDVIDEGGYGKWFRHRTGHCIGLDVHELPFISEEDQTPLEPGMTFTIEPSIFWPGHIGARIEDVIVCEPHGGRKLNRCSEALVVRP